MIKIGAGAEVASTVRIKMAQRIHHLSKARGEMDIPQVAIPEILESVGGVEKDWTRNSNVLKRDAAKAIPERSICMFPDSMLKCFH